MERLPDPTLMTDRELIAEWHDDGGEGAKDDDRTLLILGEMLRRHIDF